MPLKSEFFSAYTTEALPADSRYLPVCASAEADLLALLGDGGYAYLSIVDDASFETVKVTSDHGTLLIDRGCEGTQAVKHPSGACVKSVSPTVVAAIKDLICNYSCCEGDCPCTPVAVAGVSNPLGKAGQPWTGVVVFTGTAPVHCGVSGVPPWMSAKVVGSTVVLEGTPLAAGEWTVSCAASNCGQDVATCAATVKISA